MLKAACSPCLGALLLGLPLLSAAAECEDKGPWPCDEAGCPASEITCAEHLKTFCSTTFDKVWDEPPAGFELHYIWEHCPKTCNKCHLVGRWSRRASFLAVFATVLLLGATLVAAKLRYAERSEGLAESAAARAALRFPALKPLAAVLSIGLVARLLIASYFVNEASLPWLRTVGAMARLYSSGNLWRALKDLVSFEHLTNYAAGVAGIFCAVGRWPLAAASIMLLDIFIDAYKVVSRIYHMWLAGRGLYINELMAKKVSLLGAISMLFAISLQARRKQVFTGLLLEGSGTSLSASVALLAGRLLIAALFLHVGVSELIRLADARSFYEDGDPHDTIWPKCVELLLVVPFALGFKTTDTSRALATSLILEALTAWSCHLLPPRWDEHHREHFATNLATAGGLLLLQNLGGGRFTLDEVLSKKLT